MLLTQAENGTGGKGDTPPAIWFKDKPNSYLELHAIPKDTSLWELGKFEEFIDARKQLLLERLSGLLQSPISKTS
jgi:hypothetical protein